MTAQHCENYELFRQAIEERDAEAWAVVHSRFRPMMIAWVGRSGAHREDGMVHSDLADEAFARAWAALTPERFADFPTLARLLSYLRACVTTTVIDAMRRQTTCEHDLPETVPDVGGTPEQIVLGEIERAALWDTVFEVAATPAERIVLVESFVHYLPPRAIYARHPQLFASAAEVSRIKRNLLDRLARNQELHGLYGEQNGAC